MKNTIANIQGKDFYTDNELLEYFTEKLHYSYVDVDMINDLSILEHSQDLLIDYIYHLESLQESITERLEELSFRNEMNQ